MLKINSFIKSNVKLKKKSPFVIDELQQKKYSFHSAFLQKKFLK